MPQSWNWTNSLEVSAPILASHENFKVTRQDRKRRRTAFTIQRKRGRRKKMGDEILIGGVVLWQEVCPTILSLRMVWINFPDLSERRLEWWIQRRGGEWMDRWTDRPTNGPPDQWTHQASREWPRNWAESPYGLQQTRRPLERNGSPFIPVIQGLKNLFSRG